MFNELKPLYRSPLSQSHRYSLVRSTRRCYMFGKACLCDLLVFHQFSFLYEAILLMTDVWRRKL